MTLRFSNRIIAVTGAYGGFGRGIVQRVYNEGGKIVAIGRNRDELKKLSTEYDTDLFESVCADLGDEQGQNDIIDALISYNVDSLVNNAGTFKENLCTDVSREEYNNIMNVNSTAPLFISQGIAKHWIKQNENNKKYSKKENLYNIVNISSCASLSPLKGHMVYGLSKAAMDYWTKHMALELGSKNIIVNSVNPTIINSEMGTGKRGYWGNAFRKQWALDRIPVGRFGEVDEVVSITTYLLSNECRFINGANIAVEGGLLCGSSNVGNVGILDNIDPESITQQELQQLKDEINEIEKKSPSK